MKVKVDASTCIGCGACQAICDKVFEINDDGISEVKVKEISEDLAQDVKDAIDSCPVSAIKEA